MENVTVTVEVGGHGFPVAVHEETFELHSKLVCDSKRGVFYQGPLKDRAELSDDIRKAIEAFPDIPTIWRKCKTVLRLTTRCNEDVWNKARPLDPQGVPSKTWAVDRYLQELCRAHIPVVNKLIQSYRLAAYDYFAFEVAPWDIPIWYVDRDGRSTECLLVPYRGWDFPPRFQREADGPIEACRLVERSELETALSMEPTPGEFELLDAINLIERGDYSGAVRRVTTAIEVVVEAAVERELKKIEGPVVTARFLKDSRSNFERRIAKYEQVTGRKMPHRKSLASTRKLRHDIVHRGFRLTSADQGPASYAVDTGRRTFDWFEDDERRRHVRNRNIAVRSFGRDLAYGIFRPRILPEGVILSPPSWSDSSSAASP